MNENYKIVCRALNYFQHFLILISPVSSCVSISSFASWDDVPVGVARPAVRVKTCATTKGVKKYKSRGNSMIKSYYFQKLN